MENVDLFKYSIDFVYYLDFLTLTAYKTRLDRSILLFSMESEKPIKKSLRIPMKLSDAYKKGLMTSEEREIYREYYFKNISDLRKYLQSNINKYDWPFCQPLL